ncbi:MAG: hypothetical protein DRN25_02205 [Thermoplasmata archaeon]|nr:MAG: hypothetical protein DRN25_02205 [Thermoplasmata archaeon]
MDGIIIEIVRGLIKGFGMSLILYAGWLAGTTKGRKKEDIEKFLQTALWVLLAAAGGVIVAFI